MGCDIHCFAEVFVCGHSDCFEHPDIGADCRGGAPAWCTAWRDPEDMSESWRSYTPKEREPFIHDRSYALFRALAGVRGGEAIIEPRGFPQDASVDAAEKYERYGSAHTPSWWTLDELRGVDWEAQEEAYFAKNELKLLEKLADQVGGTHLVRIVFFFDN